MAKKKAATKTTSRKKTPTKGRAAAGRSRKSAPRASARGKHLVIVESPTKARTINKYLGSDYLVMASVGHVRDLPARAPKGVKQEVPGVDLENAFEPTYEVLDTKKKTVSDLRKAAKEADDVWFATDLDREGEAIAWHLSEALGVPLAQAKRVVFNAITRDEIAHAFASPRNIDENRVNAQQARRILDRIVGYQVSPFLWKKVAGGLSAGRVQSVAVRLVAQREREIDAFVPDEYWKINANFTTDLADSAQHAAAWQSFVEPDDRGKEPTVKQRLEWLAGHNSLPSELIELDGQAFAATDRIAALAAAEKTGFALEERKEWDDPKGKGPAEHLCVMIGRVGSPPDYRVKSIETKRTRSFPAAPFITSTLQQAAAVRLGFSLQRTMRVAQQLYEGIDIHGSEGQTGLITYMRTDSTHLTPESIEMARSYIGDEWGKQYLPDKSKHYKSPNASAQEAHEAIRPTDVQITPKRVKGELTDDQYKLYRLIWERFLGCQMAPAEWDATTVLIEGDAPARPVFKATGRTLVFDGYYKATGVPNGDTPLLPALEEAQPLAPFIIDNRQHFTSPPPRYTEASLQKKLEEEGIGRPSTYAPIIQTIQDRKYVQAFAPRDKRLMATDLGMVVTDMLTEAFPKVMDVAYTRYMELELDKIEEEHHDWVTMLREFYGPFKSNLDKAHEQMDHAKAVMEPAPHECEKCQAATVYRFGRNGRFLSCSRYPDCDYAAPIDREGNPMKAQLTDILCPVCGGAMTKRTGRFGPFLGCANYPECKGIVNIDPKKGTIKPPKMPPLLTDLPCPKCDSPLNMRDSKRGYWLSCSKFPKCRGRMAWSAVEEAKQKLLTDQWSTHAKANPLPKVVTRDGQIVGDDYVPQIDGETPDEPPADTTPTDTADAA